jgi:hypothetical protein
MHVRILKKKFTCQFIIFLIESAAGNKNSDRHAGGLRIEIKNKYLYVQRFVLEWVVVIICPCKQDGAKFTQSPLIFAQNRIDVAG